MAQPLTVITRAVKAKRIYFIANPPTEIVIEAILAHLRIKIQFHAKACLDAIQQLSNDFNLNNRSYDLAWFEHESIYERNCTLFAVARNTELEENG